MSATGHGGLTQISLTLAAAGAAGSKYTFTHNVGRALQIATVTNTTGDVISGVSVLQSSLNACVVQNLTSTAQSVMVTLQWEELSAKLNVVSSSDPRMASGTALATGLTIYVSTAGSDSVGDGSQAAPFATIDRALSVIPNNYQAEVNIQCGAGTFAPGTKFPAGVPSIFIWGDRSNPVADLSGATFAAAASSAVRYRANIGAAFSAAIGDYWVEAGYATYCRSVLASTAPNIDCAGDPSVGGFYPCVALHAYASALQCSTDATNFTQAGMEVPLNVVYIGFELLSPDAFQMYIFGAGSILAAKDINGLTLSLSLYYFEGGTDSSIYVGANPATPFAGSSTVAGQVHRVRVSQGASAQLFDLILQTVSGAGAIVICDPGSSLTVTRLDVSGALAQQIFSTTFAALTISGNIQVVATNRTAFIAASGGAVRLTSGTVTGAIAGNCVTLSNGAHATGLEAACSGTLANGSTPGNEIVVGGNAVTTFAALPTTDLAAGSPQLCRAT